VNNHNLANASTTGFRADLEAFQTRNVSGSGFASRAYATDATIGFDQTQGTLISTQRDLDVGVKGAGWLAVQGPDGREAYTRAGDLRVDASGMLVNASGHPVMGDSGPLAVPPNASIAIAADGTVSIVPLGQGPETMAQVGRLKLVNPPADALARSDDGLFRMIDGSDAPADANVQVAAGVLETSNVNIADAMVNMIELSRNFDLQVKAMRTAEENAAAAAQLLKA
jgi:flagellar basal-body rod protein FlgF